MTDAVFKVPSLPSIKRRKKVLEEETYLEEMGKIIEQDFFPDLRSLRSMNQKADADLESEIQHQVYESPATFETPSFGDTDTDVWPTTPAHRRTKSTTDMKRQHEESCAIPRISLDQFVEKYTTEDSISFAELLKDNELKHKRKYDWMYHDESKLNDMTARLTVPSIEEQAKGFERSIAVDTWTYKNHNELLFAPDGALHQRRSNAGREINFSNTSLKTLPFDDKRSQTQIQRLALNQTRYMKGKIGIDGKIITETDPMPVERGFVRTPSPMPGVSQSPLMTWGEVDGTPLRIDGSTTPAFRIQQVPEREKLALALADKVTESHRDEKRKAAEAARPVRVPTTPSRSSLFGAMSPAAQRLATSTLGCRINDNRLSISPAIRAYALGRERISSWPSSGRPHSSISPAVRQTPSTIVNSDRTSDHTSTSNQNLQVVSQCDITDNLLSISKPKRPRQRAEDFF